MKKNLSIPQVVGQVLDEHQIEYQLKLYKRYPNLAVCAQYDESPYHFITRLLEQVGIYYFFKHLEDKAILVLTDHDFPREGRECADISHQSQTHIPPYLYDWAHHVGTVPMSVNSQAYDFINPLDLVKQKTKGQVKVSDQSISPAWFKGTIFNYHEEDLKDITLGDGLCLQAQYLTANFVNASGQEQSWQAGSRFTMKTHPEPSQNAGYYIEAIAHRAQDYSHLPSGITLAGVAIQKNNLATPFYANKIRAHKIEHLFVPLGCARDFNPHTPQGSLLAPHEMLSPLPIKINRIDGLHGAIVVGPKDMPVFSDEYGRIKVQFDWDEGGSNDENSFYWARLKQGMAGAGFGLHMLPRVGQEVIVAFENGDIHQPVILGCRPSEAHPPPFNPEKYPMQSGWQSRSLEETSKSGHVIKFEDDSQKPAVSLHSHRDMHLNTAQELTIKIGGRSITTVEEGCYVQRIGDTLCISAKTAVNLVCGQSRLSITHTDIIVEADEIGFGEGRASSEGG